MKVEVVLDNGDRRVLTGEAGAVHRYGPFLEVGMSNTEIDALKGKFHTYATNVVYYRVLDENTEAKKSS